MPADELFRQSELRADLAHLVLEEIAQRLEQVQIPALRQAADVVMRLDQVRLAGRGAGRFDDVGLDRALREPLHVANLLRLFVEHLDEEPADDLALMLGVGHSGERRQEKLRSRSTRSPWLIHTLSRAPSFASSGSLPVKSTSA
jgi:hypothetical protein